MTVTAQSHQVLTKGLMASLFVFGAFFASQAVAKTPEAAPLLHSLSGSYLAGRHAQNEKDLGKAATYMGAALQLDPLNQDLIRRAFILLVADGRIDDAVAHGETIMDFDADDPIANGVLAASYIKAGDFAKADKLLAQAELTGINGFMVPILRAWAKVGLGDISAAQGLIEVTSDNEKTVGPLYVLHHGLIFDVTGKAESAEKAYRAVLNGPSGISLRLAELLGGLYHRSGEIEKAREIYNAYLESRPRSRLLSPATEALGGQALPKPVASVSEGAAEALFDIASSLRRQNARETALVLGQLALYLRPDHGAARVLVADIMELDSRPGAANAIYEQIDRGSPFWWETRLRYALNLNEMGEMDKAVEILEDLGDADEGWVDPIINLGDILRRADRFKPAIRAYNEAEKRLGKLEAQHWPLLYARGIALERSDRWEEAEKNFLQALSFNPEQPYVLNYLGYSWVEKNKNLEQAQEMIRKAVNLRPNDGFIVDSLGWVYYQVGDYEKAVLELERAVELRPQDPVINDHLGDAFWRVGRSFEARFQWRRALSFEPEDDLVEKINDKLINGLPPIKP